MHGTADIVTESLLLSTDLDRTLIPNGAAEESPRARPRFAAVSGRAEVVLVYVTGRHRALVEDAISRYGLPAPDVVIGDVGSSIYDVTADGWNPWTSWEDELAADWSDQTRSRLEDALRSHPALRLQEAARQGRFKISALAPASAGPWLTELRKELQRRHATQLVFSYDEAEDVGLLDALPARGGKLGALEFVRRRLGIARERTVFAGDSGNDLEVLTSEIPSVLVANAADDVKEQARHASAERGHTRTLYVAQGGFLGMNGNYAAGILEGLVHHLPEAKAWIP
jgi:hypothetical protein